MPSYINSVRVFPVFSSSARKNAIVFETVNSPVQINMASTSATTNYKKDIYIFL